MDDKFKTTGKVDYFKRKEKVHEYKGMTFKFFDLKDEDVFIDFSPSETGEGTYLFVDIETNGLPIYRDAKAEEINNWPYVLSLGWVLLDSQYGLVEEGLLYRKPNFILDKDAAKIHGYTEKYLQENGASIEDIIQKLTVLSSNARYIIAHNADFDLPILQAEFLRKGYNKPFTHLKKRCTMKAGKSYCEIPAYGRGYKFPSLVELLTIAYFQFDPINIEGTHNPLNDAFLTAKCFKILYYHGYIKD